MPTEQSTPALPVSRRGYSLTHTPPLQAAVCRFGVRLARRNVSDLAKILSVSRQAIGNWTSGKNPPSEHLMMAWLGIIAAGDEGVEWGYDAPGGLFIRAARLAGVPRHRFAALTLSERRDRATGQLLRQMQWRWFELGLLSAMGWHFGGVQFIDWIDRRSIGRTRARRQQFYGEPLIGDPISLVSCNPVADLIDPTRPQLDRERSERIHSGAERTRLFDSSGAREERIRATMRRG